MHCKFNWQLTAKDTDSKDTWLLGYKPKFMNRISHILKKMQIKYTYYELSNNFVILTGRVTAN